MSATINCQCGDWSGIPCAWLGPVAETVVVEFMPSSLKNSHANASNMGQHPYNGSLRRRVHTDCAEVILSAESDWATVVP